VSPEIVTVAIAAFVILVGMILVAQPIWLSLAVSGAVGLFLLDGAGVATSAIGSTAYTSTSKYALVIVPMFVLMGVFAHRAGLAIDVFALAERATRKLPGGLGVATILACGGFSAVTGSSVATVATIGRISVDQMTKHGYRANAAAALVALGATLGVLIPPSVLMVIFAILTGQSIGHLLLAGLVPGLLTMLAYMIAVIIFYKRGFFTPRTAQELALVEQHSAAVGKRLAGVSVARSTGAGANDAMGDPPPARIEGSQRLTVRNYMGAVYVLLLFVTVIGGMYSGIFTSTEAGAVAAGIALLVLVVRISKSGVREVFGSLKRAFIEAASVNSMIFALLFGGAIFAFFLLKTGLPSLVAESVIDANLPPLVVIIVSLIMLIILGAFLDEVSILLIVVPLLWPVIDQMGVDGIWYGVLAMKATAIGLVAPPVGINVFVASGISKHVSAERIYQAVLPFFIVELVVIVLLILFPGIATFLPNLMLSAG
jgi:TRAP-type C4-dicarboxylate transport system permease large subunit